MFNKKVKILMGVMLLAVTSLVIIGILVYDKATTYVAARAIVEFGNMYDALDPLEKQKLDEFLASFADAETALAQNEQPVEDSSSVGGTASTANQGSSGGSSVASTANEGSSGGSVASTTSNGSSGGGVASTANEGSSDSGAIVSASSEGSPSNDSSANNNQSSSQVAITMPGGSTRTVAEIEKMVTTEDKNKAFSIILSKMSMSEIMEAVSSLDGKMSGEKFDKLKSDMKNKFTSEEIIAIKELYNKYMGVK